MTRDEAFPIAQKAFKQMMQAINDLYEKNIKMDVPQYITVDGEHIFLCCYLYGEENDTQ